MPGYWPTVVSLRRRSSGLSSLTVTIPGMRPSARTTATRWPGNRPERAVALRRQIRSPPGDLRDVVGRAAVAYRVVVLQQGPHPRQRPGQVRIRGRGAKALRVLLVLQVDEPYAPDRAQPHGRRWTGPRHPAARAVGRGRPGARPAGRGSCTRPGAAGRPSRLAATIGFSSATPFRAISR